MAQPNGFGRAQQQWGPPEQNYTPQWGPPTQQWGPPQAPAAQWPQPSPTMPIGHGGWGNPQPPKKQKKWPWVVGGIVGVLVAGGIVNSNQQKDDAVAQPAPSTAPLPAASQQATTSQPTRKAAVPQTATQSTSAPSATSWTMPNLRGSNLQDAQDAIQQLTDDAIFFTNSHDVSGALRMQILDRDWHVCSQNIAAGTRINAQSQIDFGVVKLSESCP